MSPQDENKGDKPAKGPRPPKPEGQEKKAEGQKAEGQPRPEKAAKDKGDKGDKAGKPAGGGDQPKAKAPRADPNRRALCEPKPREEEGTGRCPRTTPMAIRQILAARRGSVRRRGRRSDGTTFRRPPTKS